jgi:LysM repeat protein
MKTRSAALDWINKQVGKSLDFDGMYGAQCADLPRFYVQFLGEEQYGRTPSAKNLWTTNWPGAFHKSDEPEVGAIAVFDGTNTNSDGHCSLVTRINGSSEFQSLDQNWVNSTAHGSPAAFVEHPMSNRILGFIVPDFLPEPEPTPAPAPSEQQPATQPTGNTFALRPHDTFWGLEEEWGLAHGTLQGLNPGLEPRTLQIGQVINVPSRDVPASPAPRSLEIKEGDTFWDLENTHEWAHGTLQNLNPTVNARLLQIGQKINIPA